MSERDDLFELWSRHGSSFESDSSEGYELADAILNSPWLAAREERVRAEERERLIATVEALHRPRTIEVPTGDCASEECCPLIPFEQCVECDRIADEVSTYYSESGASVSAWPCPTVTAIRTVSEQRAAEYRKGAGQ